ncbi:MAG: serpin family protein [Bacteroidales bacterium]|jgi:serpin B|nr:serpin family protein [Bacteroidales bacterium]HOL97093.1 serpin family protein [Bacteroidales bacterium]HOM36002.1 serpin family protein [Bacteroidales bacterium]HPD23384.1 serpin family protein [Bacteroidales bacterium]HRS99448.1 serpin family protein [Bacteroidales bacterium]
MKSTLSFFIICLLFSSCTFQKNTITNDVIVKQKQDIYNSNSTENFNDQNSIDFDLIKASFKIFKELALNNSGKSFSFSPASLNLAMAMVYAGAAGSTAEEFQKTFHFDKELSKFLPGIYDYYSSLLRISEDTSMEFKIVNKIFIEKTYPLNESYTSNIEKFFYGNFEKVDFFNDYRQQEKYINKYVTDFTKQRIKNLLPEGILNEMTKLVLINALYLKSNWKYSFDEGFTREKLFYADSDKSLKNEFMSQRRQGVKYYADQKFQVLEMEYKTDKYSMLIFLPRDSKTSNITDNFFTAEYYLNVCKSIHYDNVYYEIPKFKTESSFSFRSLLEKMGMTESFSDNADFSEISQNRDVKISEILQKVFFEIDEKGSEAAAATAVVMVQVSSAMPSNIEYQFFIANRPFIYILKENTFSTPLFMGVYCGE